MIYRFAHRHIKRSDRQPPEVGKGHSSLVLPSMLKASARRESEQSVPVRLTVNNRLPRQTLLVYYEIPSLTCSTL
jgi:hypothetical protein